MCHFWTAVCKVKLATILHSCSLSISGKHQKGRKWSLVRNPRFMKFNIYSKLLHFVLQTPRKSYSMVHFFSFFAKLYTFTTQMCLTLTLYFMFVFSAFLITKEPVMFIGKGQKAGNRRPKKVWLECLQTKFSHTGEVL